MKIIHTADLHLGSRLTSKFPKDIADMRKRELRGTFQRLAEYAKTNGVRVVLLAGDVFDSDNPSKKDRDFFLSVVKNFPDIDFLYLKGNHDREESGTDYPENLKGFGKEWTYYSYGLVTIAGIELCTENARSCASALVLDKNRLNIVTMHGQTGEDGGPDSISLKKLRDRNIDYLALGHIHKPGDGQIGDGRGTWAYPGCLEGRGFDEPGEHGFLLLETEGNTLRRTFVPFARRQIVITDTDITGCGSDYDAYRKVRASVKFRKEFLYRINLTGDIGFDTDIDAKAVEDALRLDKLCLFADVKNKTKRAIDYDAYENDPSVKGEFVRLVRTDETLSEEDKATVIRCGLHALKGRELPL